MKKFLKNTQGFTLVELIVVIAILGILAGVGTVGYSGYIKKANMAADEQIIASIHQAGALGSITDPGVMGSVTVHRDAPADDPKATVAANDAVLVKWLEAMFGADWKNALKMMSEEYDGVAITLGDSKTTEAIRKYKDSNFSGNEEALRGSMQNLSDGLVTWLGGHRDSYGGFFSSEAEYEAFKSAYGIKDESTDTEIANATVAYVASKASGMDTDHIMAAITSGNTDSLIADYGMLPTAALYYGIMTGYANSEEGKNATEEFKTAFARTPEGVGDIMDMMALMMTPGNMASVEKYAMATEKGAANDIDGYIGALEVVNSNIDSVDLSDPDVFESQIVKDMMTAILGG